MLFDDEMVKMLFVGEGIKSEQREGMPIREDKLTQIVEHEYLETNENFDSESSQAHPIIQEYLA